MDYNQLLFAAATLDLATKIRANAKSAHHQTTEKDDPDRMKKQTTWENNNPTSQFIPQALAEIKAAADIISTL
jgi:DNA primase